MYRALLLALMSLLPLTARAQDPVQADPKHYKVEFENAQVRVLRFKLGPHESTPMHSEASGVTVWLTGGHLRCSDADGKTQDLRALAKQAAWSPAIQRACENLGDQPVELYQILLKSRRPLPE